MRQEPDCSNCGIKDKGNSPECEECRNEFINKQDEFREDK